MVSKMAPDIIRNIGNLFICQNTRKPGHPATPIENHIDRIT